MSINRRNKDILFINNELIQEWDIKSANTSLLEMYDLYPKDKLNKISKLRKQDREITIGKLIRKFPDVGKGLEDAFTDIINRFVKDNNIKDENIISIKKDSVFVRNTEIKISSYEDCVYFVNKNKYTNYMYISPYEIYYDKYTSNIEIKGMSNDNYQYHENGIFDFLKDVFDISYNPYQLQKYLKQYAKDYKERKLPLNSYREFNMDSKFNVNIFDNNMKMEEIDESMLEYTDISYNYINIIIPIIKIVINN